MISNGYFFLIAIVLVVFQVFMIYYSAATFRRIADFFSKTNSKNNLTGYEMSKRVLKANNIDDIEIINQAPTFGDNYNNRTKTISFSDLVYSGKSITSQAIAIHETGHAVQYNKKTKVILLREKMLPAVQTASVLIWPVLLINLFFPSLIFSIITLCCFGLVATFYLITLPVELQATISGLKFVKQTKIVFSESEYKGFRKVLIAALFTYIATSLTWLLITTFLVLWIVLVVVLQY